MGQRGSTSGRHEEIERKFLVREIPRHVESESSVVIRQGYITSGENVREVRVRQYGERFVLGVKSGSGVRREETEIELTRDQFDVLWELTDGWRLEKVRYLLPNDERLIELDVYAGRLSGLAIAEVEFESMEACEAFVPPDWFDREISDAVEYKNSTLARTGLPSKGAADVAG